MSDGGSTVAAPASGGGIACIRRQFELRVDAVYEAPIKPPIRPRPVSFRDPKTVFAKPQPDMSGDRSDQLQPSTLKPRKATAFTRLSSVPCPDTSSSFPSRSHSSFLPSSKSSSSSQIHFEEAAEFAAAASDQTTPQETNQKQLQDLVESCDEGLSSDFVDQCQANDVTETHEFLPTDADTPEDIHESMVDLSQAEANCKPRTECTSSSAVGTPTSGGSNEMNSDSKSLDGNTDGSNDLQKTPGSNPTELKGFNGVTKTEKTNDTTNVKQAQYFAERKRAENPFVDWKIPNDKISSSSSNETSREWMKVTRSMENLCSTSAGTPTEELVVFREKKPTANNAPSLTTVAAEPADVVTSSQSLDRSVSLASKPKSPVPARKPQPPPVPKKNVKFIKASKTCRAVDDKVTGDSNTHKKSSAEEDNSSGATSGSEATGRQRSASSSVPQTNKIPRPKSLFPATQTMAECLSVESDHDKYKSLPTLNCHSPNQRNAHYMLGNRKDTMFPGNRQKLRPQMQLQPSEFGTDLTPELCRRRWVGDDQSLASPISLGNRTPPNIDSLTADNGYHVADGHQSSSVSADCLLPTPTDSDMCHAATTEPNATLPPSSSDGLTVDAASAAEPQVSPFNRSTDAFDSDNFLEAAFEFLSCEVQPIEDETTISSLKLWTDTWGKSGTKSHSETPLDASTTGSKVNDDRKGDKKSTKGDNNDQDRTDKRNAQTAVKTEEDRQRDTECDKRRSPEDKQDANKKGSFALGYDDPKAPKAPKAADVEQPNLFGVVLRQSSISSTRRRSAFVSSSAVPNSPTTDASSPVAAAVPGLDRRSSAIDRTSSAARPPSRLPSLTILPTNRPILKLPGKYVGGKPSVFLDGSSSIQTYKKTDLETAIDTIEQAFDFLDDSGA